MKIARGCKGPWSGGVFAETPRAKELISNSDMSLATVLHHRSATIGTISAENAHPFEHKNASHQIIGVHNGGVSNNKFYEDGITFSVDSDWAMYQIFKLGATKGVASLEGAMTLVWYDSSDGKIRIYSNGKRPIFWNFLKDENALFFASEHQMLYWLTSRNGLELEKQMWTTSDDRIYAFDPMNVRDHTQELLPKKAIVPVKQSPLVNSFTAGRDGTRSSGWTKPDTNIAYAGVIKTYQGEHIFYDTKPVEELGLKLGEEVEFFASAKVDTAIAYNLYGELLSDDTTVVPALMVNASVELRDNLERIIDSGGQCQVRIIGASTINIRGVATKCAIVSRPIYMVVGTQEVIVNREAVSGTGLPLDVHVYKNKTKVSAKKFLEIVKSGCFICDGIVSIIDARQGLIGWSEKDQPICASCNATLNDDGATAELVLPAAKNDELPFGGREG